MNVKQGHGAFVRARTGPGLGIEGEIWKGAERM